MFYTKLFDNEDSLSFLPESEQSHPATNIYSGIFKIGYAVGTPLNFEKIIAETINTYTQGYTPKSAEEETKILQNLLQKNITDYESEMNEIQKDIEKLDQAIQISPQNQQLLDNRELAEKNKTSAWTTAIFLQNLLTTPISEGQSAIDVIKANIIKYESRIDKMKQEFLTETGKINTTLERNYSIALLYKSTLEIILFNHISGSDFSSFIQNYAHEHGLEKIILMTDSPSTELLKGAKESGIVSGIILGSMPGKSSHPDLLIKTMNMFTIYAPDYIRQFAQNPSIQPILITSQGDHGGTDTHIYPNPSLKTIAHWEKIVNVHNLRMEQQNAHYGFQLASRTRFDVQYPIYANIARSVKEDISKSIADSLAHGAEGIGLIGSEIIIAQFLDPVLRDWEELTESQKLDSPIAHLVSYLFDEVTSIIAIREKIKQESFYEYRMTDKKPFPIGFRFLDLQKAKGGSDVKAFYGIPTNTYGIEASRTPEVQELNKKFMELVALVLKQKQQNNNETPFIVEFFGPDAETIADYRMFESIVEDVNSQYGTAIYATYMIESPSLPDNVRNHIFSKSKEKKIAPHIGSNDFFAALSRSNTNVIERDSNENNLSGIVHLQNLFIEMQKWGLPAPIICGDIAGNTLNICYQSYNQQKNEFIPIILSVPPQENYKIRSVKGEVRGTEKIDIIQLAEQINTIRKKYSSVDYNSEACIAEVNQAFRNAYDNQDKLERRKLFSEQDNQLIKTQEQMLLNQTSQEMENLQEDFLQALTDDEYHIIEAQSPKEAYKYYRELLTTQLTAMFPCHVMIKHSDDEAQDDYHHIFRSGYTKENQQQEITGALTSISNTTKLFFSKVNDVTRLTNVYDVTQKTLFAKYLRKFSSYARTSYLQIMFKEQLTDEQLNTVCNFINQSIEIITNKLAVIMQRVNPTIISDIQNLLE